MISNSVLAFIESECEEICKGSLAPIMFADMMLQLVSEYRILQAQVIELQSIAVHRVSH